MVCDTFFHVAGREGHLLQKLCLLRWCPSQTTVLLSEACWEQPALSDDSLVYVQAAYPWPLSTQPAAVACMGISGWGSGMQTLVMLWCSSRSRTHSHPYTLPASFCEESPDPYKCLEKFNAMSTGLGCFLFVCLFSLGHPSDLLNFAMSCVCLSLPYFFFSPPF